MSSSTPSTTNPSKPTILLLSLDKQPYWDEQYSNLINALSSKATIKHITKPGSVQTYIANTPPSAVIITDATLSTRESSLNLIRESLVDYVHNGGTAIIATHFSSFATGEDVNEWLRTSWDLPWSFGDYHRTTVYLTSDLSRWTGKLDQGALSNSYSQKAVFLKGVAKEDALYLPRPDSRTESVVFSPGEVDQQQTPVALTRVGDGWLGYVGDVNTEDGSDRVILSMCGL